MNWEDESYVRLYKRDTITWKLIGWEGRCVLPLLLRKVDRAGCAELEGAGVEGIAALIDVPLHVVEPGVAALRLRGVIELRGDTLVFPKFMAAQGARFTRQGRIDAAADEEYRRRKSHVYFIQRGESGPVKVGHSKHPHSRIRELQTGCPESLFLRGTAIGGRALEELIHSELADFRLSGEWFEASAALAVARRICE